MKLAVFHLMSFALICTGWFGSVSTLKAEVRLPSIFSSHMVVQQKKPIRIWGTASANEKVAVSVDGGDAVNATSAADGTWEAELAALDAGGPHTIKVTGSNTIELTDVLVGEVWVCSGQSNMEWPVAASNDPDLEIAATDFPQIRMISVPLLGTQEPRSTFVGEWKVCKPDTARDFSAVGYFFGRQLHQTLRVPVGLIDNAWGGSSCEAWIRRDLLEKDVENYGPLMDRWRNTEATFDYEKEMAKYKEALAKWETEAEAAKQAGKPEPGKRPNPPNNPLGNQHRPGNLYNGMLKPILGFPIRGAIWYQGESNAGRAYQYREMFPLMIQNWRDDWKQGEFPFYWVQLADFMNEQPNPVESNWAELREAQTLTMSKLPNTGEAVIIDIGEADDIHPRNKQDVAKRLARWALAKDYGIEIAHRSPAFKSVDRNGNKLVVTFDYVGGGLDPFDVGEVKGFAIAAQGQPFVWASAKVIAKDKIEVWSDSVSEPTDVRYAWADNPVCNLRSREGLPVTPFRSDARPGSTIDKK
jgi:sialate O-acetylesterase